MVFKYYRYFRNLRTTAEKKANQDCQYVRAKRRNLIDSWDDKPHCFQKTWKVKRDKQYRVKKRGRKHIISVNNNVNIWKLREYFEHHDIPFHVEDINKTLISKIPVFKRIKVCQVPYIVRKFKPELSHQSGYRWLYKHEQTDEFKRHKYSIRIGYNITWWSDKDIGLEYIIKDHSL